MREKWPKAIFALSISILVILSVVNCTPRDTTDSDSEAWVEVRQVLIEIANDYEDRNLSRFMRKVHDDYSDERGYRSDLRSISSRVFRDYAQIELDLHGIRLNEHPKGVAVDTHWTLRWICEQTQNQGCNSVGDVILRRGQTQVIFTRDNGEWLMISQGRRALFGDVEPGRCENC